MKTSKRCDLTTDSTLCNKGRYLLIHICKQFPLSTFSINSTEDAFSSLSFPVPIPSWLITFLSLSAEHLNLLCRGMGFGCPNLVWVRTDTASYRELNLGNSLTNF